ncbi:MAG: hypothetical protein ABR529_11245 [Actinomycetota bacterium]
MRSGALVLVFLTLGIVANIPRPAFGMERGQTTSALALAHPVVLGDPNDAKQKKAERGWWPWDWPGRVKDAVFGSVGDAINDWFKGIIQSALAPVFDLFSRTVFSTPELTSQGRLVSLWRISLGIADAALILFALTGGGIVMTSGDVGARMTAKEALPRLLLAAFTANASLLIVDQVTRLSNAVCAAIVGSGGDPRSVADQLAELVSGAFTNPFLALLGLVVIVLGLFVVATFVLRIAALVVLIAGAPLLLVCHSLPHTEHLARLWWRAMLAALAVPVAQALVLAAALKIVLSSEMLGLSSSGLVDLLVVSCLLYLILKIPLLAANAVKSGSGSRAWSRTKTVVVQTGKAVTAA